MNGKRFVYILKSDTDALRYYVGLTGNLPARLAVHNAGGCSHTKAQSPWALHVVIEFTDQDRAVHFERYLKSGSGRAFAKRHFK